MPSTGGHDHRPRTRHPGWPASTTNGHRCTAGHPSFRFAPPGSTGKTVLMRRPRPQVRQRQPDSACRATPEPLPRASTSPSTDARSPRRNPRARQPSTTAPMCRRVRRPIRARTRGHLRPRLHPITRCPCTPLSSPSGRTRWPKTTAAGSARSAIPSRATRSLPLASVARHSLERSAEGPPRGRKVVAGDARFRRGERERAAVDRGLLLLVQTSSGAGFGEGACSASRATARYGCKPPRIGPPASTSATIATAAIRSSALATTDYRNFGNSIVSSGAAGGAKQSCAPTAHGRLLMGECANTAESEPPAPA
jgi:hypothetical protein